MVAPGEVAKSNWVSPPLTRMSRKVAPASMPLLGRGSAGAGGGEAGRMGACLPDFLVGVDLRGALRVVTRRVEKIARSVVLEVVAEVVREDTCGAPANWAVSGEMVSVGRGEPSEGSVSAESM